MRLALPAICNAALISAYKLSLRLSLSQICPASQLGGRICRPSSSSAQPPHTCVCVIYSKAKTTPTHQGDDSLELAGGRSVETALIFLELVDQQLALNGDSAH
eukprot:5992225-Amphidinium_carterae.1